MMIIAVKRQHIITVTSFCSISSFLVYLQELIHPLTTVNYEMYIFDNIPKYSVFFLISVKCLLQQIW